MRITPVQEGQYGQEQHKRDNEDKKNTRGTMRTRTRDIEDKNNKRGTMRTRTTQKGQ